ncbi:MAG TPA: tRNA lysidine(34) synthetase TilS [Herpetosiphonaceae bacterium]|nr:tRNA lysidine(34) synthetase TilS [Herpetosiphonaceae bacterium]
MTRSSLVEQVGQFAAEQGLWRLEALLVVAVSGGPDSLALLHILHRLAPEQRLRLHVAHLDHRLRPDSADDARFVVDVAAAWELPVTTATHDVRPLASVYGGVEAAGRAVRYGFLLSVALSLSADAVVTGHNADDQAETVLQRLLRGAGPSGLAGMRPALDFEQWRGIGVSDAGEQEPSERGPSLVRPLLAVERTAIEDYCREQGLEPRHDPSNQSPEYLRNRVRGYILPQLKAYNSNIVAAVGRTARICADEDALLSDLLEQHWPSLAQSERGRITMERAVFEQMHRALRRRALRRAAALIAPDVELGAAHLDRMQRVAQQAQGVLQLPGGLTMHVAGRSLTLTRGS